MLVGIARAIAALNLLRGLGRSSAQSRYEQSPLDRLSKVSRAPTPPVVKKKDARLLVRHMGVNGDDVYSSDA